MTTDEERVDRGGWVAMTSRRYWGLENCRSLYIGSGNDFVFDAFLNFKPVQRSQKLNKVLTPYDYLLLLTDCDCAASRGLMLALASGFLVCPLARGLHR